MTITIRKKKSQKRREFTKVIVGAVMLTYFIVLVFGMYVIIATPAPELLDALFIYAGAPVGVVVPFYVWKAKNENMSKYGANTIEQGDM